MGVAAANPRDHERWVLTGRATELESCAHALRDSRVRSGVVLAGPAGVGKTRLAHETLVREGITALQILGSDAARGIPFGAFAAIPAVAALSGASSGPTALVAAVVERLSREMSGLTLAIDDAHLLDDMSLLLVQQIAIARAIRLLLTMRTDELIPPSLTALWKDGLVARVDVGPLDETTTQLLLTRVLGGPTDRAALSRLFGHSGGNPLYLRLLVEYGLSTGHLYEHGELWHLADASPLPATLVELVDARINSVPDSVAAVIDTLSVAEPLKLTTLVGVTSKPSVEAAERAGLISIDTGASPGVRLAHPLFGEVRRTRMGVMQARRLRGDLTRAMEGDSGQDYDVLFRATLSMDGDGRPSLPLLLEGLHRSSALLDVSLTFRLARAAINAGAGYEVQVLVAHVAELVPGEDPIAELDILARLAGGDDQHAGAALMRIVHHGWVVPEPAEAFNEIERIRMVIHDGPALAQIDAIESMLLAHQGRLHEAIKAAERALSRGETHGDTVMMACCGLVSAYAVDGSADRIDEAVQRGLSHPGVIGAATFRSPLVATQAMGLRAAGRIDLAARVARDFVSGWDPSGMSGAVAATFLGQTALAEGKVATSTRLLSEAVATLDRTGDFGGWRYIAAIALTQSLALSGSVDEAVRASRSLDARAHATMRMFDPERGIAHAMVAAREGLLADAIDLCNEAALLARSRGQWATEVLALQQIARYGSGSASERLRQLAGIVDGPRASIALAHSWAVEAKQPAPLRAASASWESIGDLIGAVDAAAQAVRWSPEDGSTKSRSVRYAMQQRTLQLLERCENPCTTESMRFARPLPLTNREREIAALIGVGLSNREIAGRLVVSVRTVEGHVYRATEKLGISRNKLGDIVRR